MIALWLRLWRWLEARLPDLTAVFDEDDLEQDDLELQLVAVLTAPEAGRVLASIAELEPHRHAAATAAAVELGKMGVPWMLIVDGALPAVLELLDGHSPEVARRWAERVGTLVVWLNLDAYTCRVLPSLVRALGIQP